MKQRLWLIAFLLLSISLRQGHSLGTPVAQVTVSVVDDRGTPVTGAVVLVSTFKKWIPGDNFGHDENRTEKRVADTNGLARISIPCLTGEISFYPQTPDGFYGSYGRDFWFTNKLNGRWQPWNPTAEVALLRILDPVPMYAKNVGWGAPFKIPASDSPVAYDLVEGDWVTPYGKGKTADFTFRFHAEPSRYVTNEYRSLSRLFDQSLTLDLSNSGDGIQAFYAKPFRGSYLRLPRTAPEAGYTNHWYWHIFTHSATQAVEGATRSDQNFIFRVRSVVESGQVVRAMYGKIHGDIEFSDKGELRFTYYLNPNTSSRSLEFDLNQNLFTNLPDLEQVREP